MIGGHDFVIPALGDAAALKSCVRAIATHWPQVRYEDAVAGAKFAVAADIPYATTTKQFAYRSAEDEAAWDADTPENSLLQIIVRPENVTIVVENRHVPEIEAIIQAIHQELVVPASSREGRG